MIDAIVAFAVFLRDVIEDDVVEGQHSMWLFKYYAYIFLSETLAESHLMPAIATLYTLTKINTLSTSYFLYRAHSQG